MRALRSWTLALLAWPAFAEAAEHRAPSIAELFLPILNFSIFLGLLYRFAWPVIRQSLAERRKLVAKEIGDATEAERAARAELAEIERLRSLQADERGRIVGALRAEGERERAALVESARKGAERLLRDARSLGEQEAARAAEEIRRAIAVRVTGRAAEILQARIADRDRQRFIDEFLAGAERGAGA